MKTEEWLTGYLQGFWRRGPFIEMGHRKEGKRSMTKWLSIIAVICMLFIKGAQYQSARDPFSESAWENGALSEEQESEKEEAVTLAFVLGNETVITQENIVDASMQVQSDPAGSQSYLVLITMDEEGKNAFAAVTAEHIGEAISIYVNDELISAPVIQMPIKDGKAVISGNFTMDEAKTLSKMLSPKKPELP